LKRFNLKDSFESVYLRESTYRNVTEKDKQVAYLDRDVFNICRIQANKAFLNSVEVFQSSGFDAQDCYTISLFWAINFQTTKGINASPEVRRKFLGHYIKKKFYTMLQFLNRKFQTNERPFLGLVGGTDELEVLPNGYLHDYSNIATPEEILIAASNIEAAEHENQEPKAQRQKQLKVSRLRLEKNIDQYAPALCHYATSKIAHYAVRKKARSFCKKYGIDYKTWAIKKIQLNPEYRKLYTIR
jgi:hypothetical protein